VAAADPADAVAAPADGAVPGNVRLVIAITRMTTVMEALTMPRNREWLGPAQLWLSSLTHAFLTQLCPDVTRAPDEIPYSAVSPFTKRANNDLLTLDCLDITISLPIRR
jgi:hypothetical protein